MFSSAEDVGRYYSTPAALKSFRSGSLKFAQSMSTRSDRDDGITVKIATVPFARGQTREAFSGHVRAQPDVGRRAVLLTRSLS